jgi:hypothetical protein
MSQEFNWEMFLDLSKDNLVIPVIGNELILVKNEENGEIIPLYDYITIKLSKKLNVSTDNLNLGDFVLRHKNEQFLDTYIRKMFNEVIEEDNLVIEPLQKLARITDFNFYISTTFDNIFEQVLKKELVNHEISEIDYSVPLRADSWPQKPINNKNVTTVFKIFGNICKTGACCAITDEEILEYIYSLKNESQVARLLFDNISGKNILFLGCDFPNWLLRFFIRIITNERFTISNVTKVIADNYICKDSKLSFFLEQYKTQIIHLSDKQFENPLVFINQLYDKWIKREESISKRYEGSVFLSFNHKDVDTVRLVRDEFRAQGIDVWFDEQELKSGDSYNMLIRKKIINSVVFIAFISQNSLNTDCYTYKVEWDLAISRRKVKEDETDPNSFIKPIILDDTNVTDDRIPEVIRKLTIDKLSTQKLIQCVKQCLKPI